MMFRRLLPALLLGTVLPASATTLNIDITVDNEYLLYLSTDDMVPGTLIGSDADWTTTESWSVPLTSGQDYYLHIEAIDVGVISGFLGDFTLSDTNFSFANGGQYLLTGVADWNVSDTGFGTNYAAPVLWSYNLPNANNGVMPWGTRSGIDANAEWIWRPDKCTYCTAYFSTPIRAQSSPVPEPGPLVLVTLAGLLLIGIHNRKRQGRVA